VKNETFFVDVLYSRTEMPLTGTCLEGGGEAIYIALVSVRNTSQN
jgi:hypothetical protein